MRIALAGNPNSGKTTLYNEVTGKSESVGNWSGVTVSKKEAELRQKYLSGTETVRIVDLPGAYSMSPFTGEEAITKDFIVGEKPDVIINIVDGANLERSLFLTTQLLELNLPLVVALNKGDLLLKRGDQVDTVLLSEHLGCPVIVTTASSGEGLLELMEVALSLAKVPGNGRRGQLLEGFSGGDQDRQRLTTELVTTCRRRSSEESEMIGPSLSDRIDSIVAHKWWGLPIFFLVMWAVFSLAIKGIGGYFSDYLNDVFFGEIVPKSADTLLTNLGVAPLLKDLLINGVLGGIGAVIGFLPLIMALFFLLSLLEDSGYMARVAMVMDRYFKKIGLSGKSVIPMIVGSGCAIPGVMATRTIEDENERRMTTMLTPFVPCSAKLPIIALFTAAFFPDRTWVGASAYLLAIAMIIVGGLLLKRIYVWDNPSRFIMEIPPYKLPSIKYALRQMLDKAKGFIYKASTIILVCNTFVWFTQTYGWNLQPVDVADASMLATLGAILAPLMLPLGFMGWQMAAATITGFIAKENVVATLAVILAVASEETLHAAGGPLATFFNPVTAYAFLAFNLFTPPCFAAIGAMNAEMGSGNWLRRALAFQLGVGYVLAMLIAQLGTLVVYHQPALGWQAAIGVTVAVILYLRMTIEKTKQQSKAKEEMIPCPEQL